MYHLIRKRNFNGSAGFLQQKKALTDRLTVFCVVESVWAGGRENSIQFLKQVKNSPTLHGIGQSHFPQFMSDVTLSKPKKLKPSKLSLL